MTLLTVVKAIVPLIFILGLLYAVLWAVKKYSFSFNGKKSGNIKVLSTQMILPKKYISLVKIEDKVLVLGVSEHSVNLLKELDHVPEDIGRQINAEVDKDNFIGLLRKNLGMK